MSDHSDDGEEPDDSQPFTGKDALEFFVIVLLIGVTAATIMEVSIVAGVAVGIVVLLWMSRDGVRDFLRDLRRKKI